MFMEQALRKRLLDTAPANVGEKVDWVQRPDTDSLPGVTLQMISDPRDQHMKGFQNKRRAVVQVDVWAHDYEEAYLLKEWIIATLVPAATVENVKFDRGSVTARDLGERSETAAFIFRPSMDFTLFFKEV